MICRVPSPFIPCKTLGFNYWFYNRLKNFEKQCLPFNLPTCTWKQNKRNSEAIFFFQFFFFNIFFGSKFVFVFLFLKKLMYIKWTLDFDHDPLKKPLKSPWIWLRHSCGNPGSVWIYVLNFSNTPPGNPELRTKLDQTLSPSLKFTLFIKLFVNICFCSYLQSLFNSNWILLPPGNFW